MHLRSLTLKGFKSFPERTRLEFSPGVSVIVGPNGSGKSNITDAVLWALGEQSPLNVRGQSMQDVIFAGAHGVQARSEASVEVVLDNTDGIDLPMSEIAIGRSLDRTGEGGYTINGAKCRLTDVTEVMSDTGLGKEMHSVVSQGRVTQIVTSKPRDRRILIEEAAGLGKHRKRRRRAQLKLERTTDNLDRALDVEREARSRLRPLKRQAEAAELHERLERQSLESRWTLARDDARAARATLSVAEADSLTARQTAEAVEAELREVAARREQAETALAARGTEREELSSAFHRARSAAERVEARQESASDAAGRLSERAVRRRALVAALEDEAASEEPDAAGEERVADLERELEQLSADRAVRLEAELAALATQRDEAAAEVARCGAVLAEREAERAAAEEAFEGLRTARREAERAADAARREAARVGADLAGVNQFLRSQAGAPGGARALGDALRAKPGFELALAAVLGPRLRAALASDLVEARALVAASGADGGAALVGGVEGEGSGVADGAARAMRGAGAPQTSHAENDPARPTPLIDAVVWTDAAAEALARALLGDVYVVDEIPTDLTGIAVTKDGLVWDARNRELRRVPAGGEDRVLAERNRRDALVAETEQAAQAEQAAKAAVEQAVEDARESDTAREEADRAARAARRAHADAQEQERQVTGAAEARRRAPDDAETAARRAQIDAALSAERRYLERAARDREQRRQRIVAECARAQDDEGLAPVAEQLAGALAAAAIAIAERVETFAAALKAEREAGDQLAGELRACAQQEAQVQARLKAQGEAVTRAEVRAQQVRDQAADADATLTQLAERLGLEARPAEEPLPDEERENLQGRIERLQKRREQLGPVNPLAKAEYDEAVAHVEELETQREDLEAAIRELQGIIKDTDERIKQAFEETFAAAATNFEDVVGQLFPGGRGRLRLVREDTGPRPVLGGQEDAAAPEPEVEDEEERDEDEQLGVEIEITPAGKATKRLSLLSGGEKSMTALAFLFAVFLARPCPFYILDEVEAALDDLNIDRFLTLLRRYSDRAQFIVVTHQKRTMEAADCLYGVSMAGNGVSKVVSRRLPREAEAAA